MSMKGEESRIGRESERLREIQIMRAINKQSSDITPQMRRSLFSDCCSQPHNGSCALQGEFCLERERRTREKQREGGRKGGRGWIGSEKWVERDIH